MYAELNAVWQDGLADDAVPASTAAVLDLPAGTDADIGVTLVDSIGKRIDLNIAGGDKLELIARLTTGALLLSKQAAKRDDGVGRYQFSFAANDTRDYRGKLIYEVYATRSAVRRRVIAPGHILLGLGVAQ